MDYQECKFYVKYGRCNHRNAPEPYHSQCFGKEQCIVWNDPITNRALDADSPIQNTAQELYEALKWFVADHLTEYENLDKGISVATKRGKKLLSCRQALAKAEGK